MNAWYEKTKLIIDITKALQLLFIIEIITVGQFQTRKNSQTNFFIFSVEALFI